MRQTSARRMTCPNKSASGNHLGQTALHPPGVDDERPCKQGQPASKMLPNEANGTGLHSRKSQKVALPDKCQKKSALILSLRATPSGYRQNHARDGQSGFGTPYNCYRCFSSRNVNITEARSTGFSNSTIACSSIVVSLANANWLALRLWPGRGLANEASLSVGAVVSD
jgi:hypothetical protein